MNTADFDSRPAPDHRHRDSATARAAEAALKRHAVVGGGCIRIRIRHALARPATGAARAITLGVLGTAS